MLQYFRLAEIIKRRHTVQLLFHTIDLVNFSFDVQLISTFQPEEFQL